MKFELVNRIPKNFPPGKYNTRIVEADFLTWTIKLEFLGTPYDPENPQCLLPVTKE